MSTAIPRTIAQVLDRGLAGDPHREALVTRSRRLTYAELDAEADRAAHALAALGVKPGDRVAASLPNDAAVVVAFHGAMRLGAVWLGINRALAPPEKQFQLDDVSASLLLCDDELPDLGTRVVAAEEWQALMADADGGPIGIDVDPEALAGIAYTSGTTGRPKGVMHSQRGLLTPGALLVESRGYDATLRKADCFPFTILNLAVLTTLLVSQAGGTSIVMDRIDAEGVAEWLRTERPNVWNGPPALLHSLAAMDEVAAGDLASLEEVWTGGADCPEAIRRAFTAKFGQLVLSSYGLTEAPTVISIDPVGGPHVAGASGIALPHLDVRIIDGEVCVVPAPGDDRYPFTLGYWQRPDATAELLAGGVLHTGDIGFLDDDGYLHLRDRKSLVILRGGANVYPAEVERVLQEVDGIAASAVIGVPDERLGERVVAVVEVSDSTEVDLDALREHCLGQLAKYKVPERFVVVDALPRNAMGKIVRTELPALL
ncbi:class I adenylate-forming enzyme family protein [Aquihabitans sp. McL0605]|uniref:class I adenylate-forming enzyme family protein n=1 Tax=Aquihabitans sp. McL0605 TaxID=3415671 RepID=UPI003CE966DC